jgi:predicted HAD superfamily phosphohydrolase YqeG
MFPEVPVFRGYRLGSAVRMRQRFGETDSWSEAELAEHLAAGAIPLRKPSAELVQLAAAAIDRPVGEVVMVGDQFLTDVAGASLAGARSVKLPNPARQSFPLSIRFTQRLEAILYSMTGHGRRGRTP